MTTSPAPPEEEEHMHRSTMTLTSTSFLVGATVLAVVISACGGSD